jgi:hypothetical protein
MSFSEPPLYDEDRFFLGCAGSFNLADAEKKREATKPLVNCLAAEALSTRDYDAAKRISNKIEMGVKMKENIALVVVDAVAPEVDLGDGALIVKDKIQNLTDRMGVDSYELFTHFANIYRTTHTAKLDKKLELKRDYSDIVLVGGAVGNQHYDVFLSLLTNAKDKKQAISIHIPLDCTYGVVNDRFDGEDFMRAELPTLDIYAIHKYRSAIKEFGTAACIIEEDGSVVESSPINKLKLWNESEVMLQYLNQK